MIIYYIFSMIYRDKLFKWYSLLFCQIGTHWKKKELYHMMKNMILLFIYYSYWEDWGMSRSGSASLNGALNGMWWHGFQVYDLTHAIHVKPQVGQGGGGKGVLLQGCQVFFSLRDAWHLPACSRTVIQRRRHHHHHHHQKKLPCCFRYLSAIWGRRDSQKISGVRTWQSAHIAFLFFFA